MNNEKRWLQRFQNLENSYAVFLRRVKEYEEDNEREAFQLSLIQSFEIIVELSWKTLKDYLENEGFDSIYNGKQAIRVAFQAEIIRNAETWMIALQQRNLTSHTYNAEVLVESLEFIHNQFYPVLRDLHFKLNSLRDALQ